MNEDLAKQLSSILNDKNIDLNQILESFKANSSGENTNNSENQQTPNNCNSENFEKHNSQNSTASKNSEKQDNNNTNNFNFSQIDPNTLLKMSKLLNLMNTSRIRSR